MKKRILIDYPFQRARKLYDSMDGEVWFGAQEPFEEHKRMRRGPVRNQRAQTAEAASKRMSYTTIWSTGHQGQQHAKLIVLEPPSVQPWAHEDWFLDLFEGVLSFKPSHFEHVVPFRHPLPLGWPDLPLNVDRNRWEHRKDAVVAIMGNKHRNEAAPAETDLYERRVQVLDALHERGVAVDCYGRPGFEGKPWYRGELEGDAIQKRRKLAQYRYALCMENCVCENYVTEKLPEAIMAGCIPIYEGAPNLEEWPFPHEFIVEPTVVVDMGPPTFRDEQHYSEYLDAINPAAINEAFSCRSLFELILSLSD